MLIMQINGHCRWGDYFLPVMIDLMSFSLLRAAIGVRLLMSVSRISSRIWLSTGSSSWKNDSCTPPCRALPISLRFRPASARELSASNCFKTSLARLTMTGGSPASFATWIPKLCSLPPFTNLRTKTTLPFISLTDTL